MAGPFNEKGTQVLNTRLNALTWAVQCIAVTTSTLIQHFPSKIVNIYTRTLTWTRLPSTDDILGARTGLICCRFQLTGWVRSKTWARYAWIPVSITYLGRVKAHNYRTQF